MGKKRRHRGFYGMRKRKNAEVYEDLHSDMDGTFAFIAGYTSGGAPYGVNQQ